VTTEAEPLRKTEIKWWWPILVLVLALGTAWGSIQVKVQACEIKIDAIEATQHLADADRLIIESRLTRIETKLDSIIEMVQRIQ